jgi:hypothetical protein
MSEEKIMFNSTEGISLTEQDVKDELFEEFKTHYKPPQTQDLDYVLKKVKEINNLISLKSDKAIFDNRGNKKVQAQRKKAMTSKFFLNIGEGNFPPSVWIPYLYNGKEI